ncbi:MAG: PKD domain-containing protein, partial [Candidatus Thermoplasmatota archaeon]|nr:PKD domain-containing protein [Candidatus Thermoplasmatota archaeon]
WEFASWSGDLSGTDNTTNITMNSNKTITATFTDIRIYYTLTINIIGNGTVNPPTGNKYLEGTIVDIRATPNAGWQFTNWTGDLTGSTKSTTITMNSNKEITAHFTTIVTVKITKPENNHLYLFDIGFKSTEDKPHIIGPINIKVQAESDNGIARVEFLINNELKKTDNSSPYSWICLLKPKGNVENYTITVKAYDEDGNTNKKSINVTRSKFNPILNHKKLILILAVAGLAGLILLRNQSTEQNGVIPNEPDNDSYNINQVPIIDAGGPYNSRVGEPVYFDASSSYDPDGDLLTYEWNFGDGSVGVGAKQSHTYEKAGKYDVKLTVTDSEGNSDTQTVEVEITDGSKTIGISEDDWFWYIVSGLALAITVAVGLLFIGGKLYV